MKRKTALFSPSKLFNTTEHELPSAFSFTHFYTHSTAVEGSTVTEVENRLLFDDGISPNKPLVEQLMNKMSHFPKCPHDKYALFLCYFTI